MVSPVKFKISGLNIWFTQIHALKGLDMEIKTN